MSSDYTTIKLSKRGKKNAGKFEAKIDPKNTDLASFNWAVKNTKTHNTQYAWRHMYDPSPHRKTKQKRVWLHRIILERKLGRELLPEEQVDHIDGNGLNNLESNLRLATNAENQHNSRKHRDNTSGIKGVHWNTRDQKWRATIKVEGEIRYLGSFTSKREAADAYKNAAKKHYKEFANYD